MIPRRRILDLRSSMMRMMRALLDGPCTVQDLREASGMADSSVRLWIHAARKAGVLRIAAWERIPTGQSTRPVYELNPEGRRDVARPPRTPASKRAARYRLRKRQRAAAAAMGGLVHLLELA